MYCSLLSQGSELSGLKACMLALSSAWALVKAFNVSIPVSSMDIICLLWFDIYLRQCTLSRVDGGPIVARHSI